MNNFQDGPVRETSPGYEKTREKDGPSVGVKIGKALAYGASRFVLLGVLVVVMSMAFNIGMNSMNVYTMIKDGFSLRAQHVLRPAADDEEKLDGYFTNNFLLTDEVINSYAFEDYVISNYYERVDIDSVIVWPWDEKVTVTVVEQVMDITGTYSGEYLREHGLTEEDVAGEEIVLPEWPNGRYELTLVQNESTELWQMHSIKFIDAAEDEMMEELSVGEDSSEEGGAGENTDAAEDSGSEDASAAGAGLTAEDYSGTPEQAE